MILLLLLLFHLIKKAEITLTQLAELACMGGHNYSQTYTIKDINKLKHVLSEVCT